MVIAEQERRLRAVIGSSMSMVAKQGGAMMAGMVA